MAKRGKATASSGEYNLELTGSFDGKIRDVDVGLVTGKVTQTNKAAATAINAAIGNTGNTSQTAASDLLQVNELSIAGDASLGFTVNGSFKGQIRDIEVGLVTGNITQRNVAEQIAFNAAVGNHGATDQSAVQAALQANIIDIAGTVDVSFVTNGKFHGQIRDVEVGLITGDIVQTNYLSQIAANLAFASVGSTTQKVQQETLQANVLRSIADVNVTVVFEGDFKGKFRDVSIGVITADVLQSNSSVAVGLNIASANDGRTDQSISQFASQRSWIDASGDLNVELRIDDGFKGQIRDLDIQVIVDNVLNGPSGDIWS